MTELTNTSTDQSNISKTVEEIVPGCWGASVISYMCAEVVVGVLTVLINAWILLAISRYRSLRTHTNVYIGSLAIADVLVGFLIPPLAITSHIKLEISFMACVLISSLISVFFNISIISLVFLAFDRYLAVQHPILHRRMVNRTLTKLVIALSWLAGGFLGLVTLFAFQQDRASYKSCTYRSVIDIRYNVYVHSYSFLFPVSLIMLVLHVRIFFAFRAANKRRVRMMSKMCNQDKVMMRVRRKEAKLFKSLALIFCVFGVVVFPLQISHMVILYCPGVWISRDVISSLVVLQHTNSFSNALVYALSQVSIRQMMELGLPKCLFQLCSTDTIRTPSKTAPKDSSLKLQTALTLAEVTQGPAARPRSPFRRRQTILWDDPTLDSTVQGGTTSTDFTLSTSPETALQRHRKLENLKTESRLTLRAFFSVVGQSLSRLKLNASEHSKVTPENALPPAQQALPDSSLSNSISLASPNTSGLAMPKESVRSRVYFNDEQPCSSSDKHEPSEGTRDRLIPADTACPIRGDAEKAPDDQGATDESEEDSCHMAQATH